MQYILAYFVNYILPIYSVLPYILLYDIVQEALGALFSCTLSSNYMQFSYIEAPLKLRPYGAIQMCILLLLLLRAFEGPWALSDQMHVDIV